MSVATKRKQWNKPGEIDSAALSPFISEALRNLGSSQTVIPRLAKDEHSVQMIEQAVKTIPTSHQLFMGDAREIPNLLSESVHLVLTSPPYWTLKDYRDSDGQLGHVQDYDEFLEQLDRVWRQCFNALVPGGRLICVVGDVCLSRRENAGRHTVVPLHASIQEHCRQIGLTILLQLSGIRSRTPHTRLKAADPAFWESHMSQTR